MGVIRNLVCRPFTGKTAQRNKGEKNKAVAERSNIGREGVKYQGPSNIRADNKGS